MKYEIKPSNQFKKDVRLINKRGYDITLLTEVIEKLANGEMLDSKYKDHRLLVYEIEDNNLILYLSRTGTHSDLF